mgnify:CR=1 FL=1
MPSNLRRFSAKLVRISHLFVMLFIMIGWALPWRLAWWIHVVLTPLTRVHWKLNNRTCIFTTIENRLLQTKPVADHEEGWFVKEMTEAITGWRPPTTLTRIVMAFWMWISTILSAIRLAVV